MEGSFHHLFKSSKSGRPELIINGDIDSAFKRLEEWYPQVLKAEQLEGAVKYARANLANFLAHKAFEGLLKESVALLAYEKPSESCIGYLLESPQREFVADAVNAAILSTNPKMKDPESCLYSCLEKLLRQLTLHIVNFKIKSLNSTVNAIRIPFLLTCYAISIWVNSV
uniref:Uncharacterized protein n=1 Tax=Aegilops tauschii TaxID=37682 RepID=R7W7Z9_AEGTA